MHQLIFHNNSFTYLLWNVYLTTGDGKVHTLSAKQLCLILYKTVPCHATNPSSFTVCACKFISLNIHFNNQTESANPAFISTCCNLALKKSTLLVKYQLFQIQPVLLHTILLSVTFDLWRHWPLVLSEVPHRTFTGLVLTSTRRKNRPTADLVQFNTGLVYCWESKRWREYLNLSRSLYSCRSKS